jgi:hypothetical protein
MIWVSNQVTGIVLCDTECPISCNMSCQSRFLPATFKIWASMTIADTLLHFLFSFSHMPSNPRPFHYLSNTVVLLPYQARQHTWLAYGVFNDWCTLSTFQNLWYKNGRWKSRADPLDKAAQSTAHLSWTGSILWFYSNAYLLLCIEHAICRVGVCDVPCSELRVHVEGWLCSGTNGPGRGRRWAGPLE